MNFSFGYFFKVVEVKSKRVNNFIVIIYKNVKLYYEEIMENYLK